MQKYFDNKYNEYLTNNRYNSLKVNKCKNKPKG